VQGVFLRRQAEVAAVYSRLVAREVLGTERLVKALVSGESVQGGPERLESILRAHLIKAFDVSKALALLGFGFGEASWLRTEVVASLIELFPKLLSEPQVVAYIDGAVNAEVTLRGRLTALPPAEFEALLHPVFKEDEWKLVAVGGALGAAVGLLQAYLIN